MPILCTDCMVWNSLPAHYLGIYYPPPSAIAAGVGMNARVAAFAWVMWGLVGGTGCGLCGDVTSGRVFWCCVRGVRVGVCCTCWAPRHAGLRAKKQILGSVLST